MRKLLLASCLVAAPAAAQQAPAVRLINAPDASSPHTFGAIAAVRQLPGGQLLVNDVANRQLSLLAPTLAASRIVADSASGSASSYGSGPGALIAYLGDSSLFIDPAGLSMFVITPAGAIERTAAVPRSQDARMLGIQQLGKPSVDAKGRIVYRGMPTRALPVPQAKGMMTFPDPPDSAVLVRVDPTTRKLDTLTFFKIPKVKMNITQTDHGFMATTEINPMPVVDDWAVASDGAVGVVRGQDYHVDWVDADGQISPTPKIPFDWQRLTDDDKTAVLDSARAALDKQRAAAASSDNAAPKGTATLGGGGEVRVMVAVGGDGGGGGRGNAGGLTLPGPALVSASELPDYRPAFSGNAVRADLDDNLWIQTSETRAGSVAGPIYDVVNRKGELTARVQLPAGRTIVGFGKGGTVYMIARDGSSSWVERTHSGLAVTP